MANEFEKANQNVCSHIKHWRILGTGGSSYVGKHGHFYNGYYCPKCKKVYYEDTVFSSKIKVFYSKKETNVLLKEMTTKGGYNEDMFV
ncbi:MAG: hypothetical protein K0R54_805 [Clostridiaceae bacterium]|jgi:hypothetical protein|nr:hypothetical protein [Clostridiaceae bacterium]